MPEMESILDQLCLNQRRALYDHLNAEFCSPKLQRNCSSNDSVDEAKVRKTSLDFESKFFSDMMLHQGPYQPPSQLRGMKDVTFRIDPALLGKRLASYDRATKTITVSSAEPDVIHLLHEMIHHYDCDLFQPAYHNIRDLVVIYLYEQLLRKYPRLYEMLTDHIGEELVNFSTDGTIHSRLFVLKSLDLDFKFGTKPGTVYGYDMEEKYAKYF